MAKIEVQCPICRKNRTHQIPNDFEIVPGISSVLVVPDSTCPHILKVFIDANYHVRGLQVVGFDQLKTGPNGTYEVLSGRRMSLRGAYKVFDETFFTMLACLMQREVLILCNDIDVALSLFGTLDSIFPDDLEIGHQVIINDECVGLANGSVAIDMQLTIILKDKVGALMNLVLKEYLNHAIRIEDNQASAIFMRQRLSTMDKIANHLESIITVKMTVKELLTNIESSIGIKLGQHEIHAILEVLRASDKGDLADLVVTSKLSDF